MYKLTMTVYLILTCLFTGSVSANEAEQLLSIQKTWAEANYELTDDAQINAFKTLSAHTALFVKSYPDSAQTHIWHGIVLARFAGAKGGLSALGLAKDAKLSLEQAINLDGNALNGSAYASLATLYSKVPGWPIGFGSDKKAQENFKLALALNEKGIDNNYLYAEFLYGEKQYNQAKTHLLTAQAAGVRDNRQKADQYRQHAISQLLAKVNKKLER